METVYAWGIEVIKAFQAAASPALTATVKTVTFFGSAGAYIIFLAVIFWCIDEKKGARLVMVTLVSAGVNTIVKNILKVPRPYERDPSVGLATEKSWSTPSGHAQTSAAFWGTLMTMMKSKWKWLVGFGIPFVIGCSRIYLGVHYPTDVLFGWFLGAVTAGIAAAAFPLTETYITPLPRMIKILVLAAFVFVMNMLCPEDTSIPGAIFGFGTGCILLRGAGGFSAAKGSVPQKILRFLTGGAGAAILYIVLSFVFPSKGAAQYNLFRFLRYALIGFWAGYAAPKLFTVLGIAEPAYPREERASGASTPDGDGSDAGETGDE